jgi:hypothetical protein
MSEPPKEVVLSPYGIRCAGRQQNSSVVSVVLRAARKVPAKHSLASSQLRMPSNSRQPTRDG